MRPLTFTGFLAAYVRALGGEDTLALRRLVELSKTEPRLVEPLVLWAVTSGHTARLTRLMKDTADVRQELATVDTLHRAGHLESALAAHDSRLRPEYSKVWRSYVVRRDAAARDAHLRLEARKRILTLEARTGVTRYRMAKDLGLNPGNLHAFLAQGNPNKLSLARVAQLQEYLERSNSLMTH